MDSELLELSTLVCARLCHDFGGLAGTLTGMLDLAQEEGGEALALAREAADVLARRVRLFRAAWGQPAEPLGAARIAELALGLDERLTVDVSGLGSTFLPPDKARLAVAMLLLSAEALPSGGTLRLVSEPQGGLSVLVVGPRANWRPETIKGLSGQQPTRPRDATAPICALLARSAGMSLAAAAPPPDNASAETPLSLHAKPLGRSPG